MSSSGTFARIGLIAAVSVVLGISTLTPLLKQTTAPVALPPEGLTPFVLAAPPVPAALATTGQPAAEVSRPLKTGVSYLTVEAPVPAVPTMGSSPATAPPPSPTEASAAAAPSPPAQAAPPATGSALAAPALPPVQADDGSAAAAAQAAVQPASPAVEPAPERARKNAAKRASDRSAPKQVLRVPFSYNDRLTAH